MDQARARVRGLLKDHDQKTAIIIYNDVELFQRKSYGLFISWYLGDYAVGACKEDTVHMASPLIQHETNSYEDMLQIAAHEMIHAEIYRIKPFADIWLDEGAATYFSGQKDDIIYEIPTFEEINQQGLSEFMDADGYMFSYYYVEYIIGTFGEEAFYRLMSTDAYEESIGTTKEQLYEDWCSYIETIR